MTFADTLQVAHAPKRVGADKFVDIEATSELLDRSLTRARVVELADTQDSGSCAERRAGSTPAPRTTTPFFYPC